jgi:D-alanine-D-alanine ligase
MSARRTIAVLFGGRSLEHDVSIASGLQILHAIDPNRFEPFPVYIDQQVRWWTGNSLWHNESFKGGGPDRSQLVEVVLSPGFGKSYLMPSAASFLKMPIDVFVPALHGTYGEDGCIQGQLELNGCAYVGCGVLASSTGMNKRVTKILASHEGVPIVPWVSCPRSELDRGKGWLKELPAKIESSFGWPVIVKPCNLGSSAGVSVARSAEELISGIFRVFECDTEALIEPFIKNRLELNVAVAGLDEPVASITEMPITNQTSPLNFSEKYKRQGGKIVSSMEGMAGALRIIDPPDLPSEMRARAQKYATTVFSVLGCEGISRIDFLIDADTNELFFNEINTLPGSLAYYLWSTAPHYWTVTELLTRLISRAEKLRAAKMGLLRQPPPDLRLF